MVPLPDCASGEWGPTKATRLFGLIPITHQVATHKFYYLQHFPFIFINEILFEL